MVRKVYIVRHGNTFDKGDVVTRVGARTDLPLSSSGQTQAEQLAAYFMLQEPDGFIVAHSGPLQRTLQTAETILAAQEDALPPLDEEFLREIDYGPDENKPEDEVVARIGDAALKAWEDDAVPPPDWQVDPSAIIGAWRSFFKELADLPDSDARPVLVVTSNGIARFVLKAAAIPSGAEFPLKLKTAAFGVVEVDAEGAASVTDWNIRV